MRHLNHVSAACIGALLALSPVAANAAALSFVNVAAPAINCIFNATCTITVTDSVGAIPFSPGTATGKGILQTRTYKGMPGTPGAGLTGYEYRIDMTQAVSPGEAPCITDLAVDFGPVTKLKYKAGDPKTYDVFVITKGGIGTVPLFDVEQTGSVIDFVPNQPICAGVTPGTGLSSYFFGLASTYAPKAVTAHVGWPGLLPLDVAARAPAHLHILKPIWPLKPLKVAPVRK